MAARRSYWLLCDLIQSCSGLWQMIGAGRAVDLELRAGRFGHHHRGDGARLRLDGEGGFLVAAIVRQAAAAEKEIAVFCNWCRDVDAATRSRRNRSSAKLGIFP